MAGDVTDVLDGITSTLPSGGERRPGQEEMARAVDRAIRRGRNLVVQAGTGTGKSLGYLVPAALSGRTVVVATATKALQDQLADKDLPRIVDSMPPGEAPTFAVLKGRSNYLCLQRAAEVGPGGRQPELAPPDGIEAGAGAPGNEVLPGHEQLELLGIGEPDPGAGRAGAGRAGAGRAGAGAGATADRRMPGADDGGTRSLPSSGLGRTATSSDAFGIGGQGIGGQGIGGQVRRILDWARTTETGDRAELSFEPTPTAWAAVSISARDCPGAFRCPSGNQCFAERARARAAESDIIVVNTHLYGAHLASGGAVLPPHDVVVFDEAHEVEAVMTDSLGSEVGSGRIRALATQARSLLPSSADRDADAVLEAATALDAALGLWAGQRVPPGELAPDNQDALAVAVQRALRRVERLVDALRASGDRDGSGRDDPDGDARARRDRTVLAGGHLVDDLNHLTAIGDDEVAWVDDAGRSPTLRVSPIEVGPILAESLWPERTAILTSATVPPGLAHRLGLPPDDTDEIDVGSPFDYEHHALLYVAADLPDRRSPQAEGAIADSMAALIEAAGGRTLALFTSWRAMHAAAEAVRERIPFTLLVQGDLPKPALTEAFRSDPETCLFATMGFWQGVDVPGRSLSLVTIDRIPFPRPDDPVLQARRDRAGPSAFRTVDLPRAATLLAQGVGRLVRTSSDRGVVAVLDSRLAKAGYRKELLGILPPMRRTTSLADATSFLAGLD